MNTKTGQIVSILLIVGLSLLWSVSILGAETDAEHCDSCDSKSEAAETSVALAADATEKAASEALESIANEARTDLDLGLIDRNSVQVAAN